MGKAKRKSKHVEVMAEQTARRSNRAAKPPQKLNDYESSASSRQGEAARQSNIQDVDIMEDRQSDIVESQVGVNEQLLAQLKLAQERISALEDKMNETHVPQKQSPLVEHEDEAMEQAYDFQLPSSSRVQNIASGGLVSNHQKPHEGMAQQKSGNSEENDVQQMLTSALSQILNPEEDDKEGEQMISKYFVLGATLDPKIKSKIWSREYIDLATLKDKVEPRVSVSVEDNGNPSISLKANKSAPVPTYIQWLQSFGKYAAVYLERFPEEGPSIMTYIIKIFEMSKRQGGYVWRSYDESFRRMRSYTPVPWHKTNWELVFNVQSITETSLNKSQPFRRNPNFNNQGGKGKPSKGIYFSYDKTGKCTNKKQPCPFRHECSFCNKKGHGKNQCYAKGGQRGGQAPGNQNN